MGGGLARTLEAGRGEGRFSTRVVARYAARERPGQAFDVGLPEVQLIEPESKSVSSHEFWSACIRVNGLVFLLAVRVLYGSRAKDMNRRTFPHFGSMSLSNESLKLAQCSACKPSRVFVGRSFGVLQSGHAQYTCITKGAD